MSSANGLQWDVGAISNAEWSGVRLRDVLKDAGLQVDDPPEHAQHVQLYGGEGYGASIPIDKATSARGDVLLVSPEAIRSIAQLTGSCPYVCRPSA